MRGEFIKGLEPDEVETLMRLWCFAARQDQLEPGGKWNTWLIQAGRGWGKSRCGSEWSIERALADPGCRIALVGRASSDVRDVMIEGESGILSCAHDSERPEYEPSKRRLTWPNGSIATTFTSERSDQLRGPQFHYAWCDEIAAWSNHDAWDQLKFGMRLGVRPRVVVTTTPRPLHMLRKLAELDSTHVTRGSTMDNAANLSADFIEAIHDRYAGSTIGRQELRGELLSELPGALFLRRDLDACRVDSPPNLRRIVVAVDPATTSNAESDESGLVVAGLCSNGHLYILEDLSMRGTPDAVCRRAIEAYKHHKADRLVFESNQGGETWRTISEQLDRSVPVKLIHASKGKHARAEPIGARLEQQRLHICGIMPALADQVTNYVPGRTKQSPDRLDAMVWSCTELDEKTIPEIKINPSDGHVGGAWI